MAKDYDEIAAQFGGTQSNVDRVDQLAQSLGGVSKGVAPYDVYGPIGLGMKALQGLTFGFGDEIASKAGLDKDRYEATLKKTGQDYPLAGPVSEFTGSFVAPFGVVSKLLKGAGGLVKSGVTGSIAGGLYGAGDAPEGEKLEAGTNQAALGLGFAPLGMGVIKGGGAVGEAVLGKAGSFIPKVGGSITDNIARRSVARAIDRDGIDYNTLRRNMFGLGQEARVADSAGQSTRSLLDVNANMPGTTPEKLDQLLRNRIATRPERMDDVVYAVNGGYGKGANLVDALQEQKEKVAGPLYEKLHSMQVAPTENLVNILKAADKLGAFSEGSVVATAKMRPFTLKGADVERLVTTGYDSLTNSTTTKLVGGKPLNMSDLDYVKRGLDSLIEKETDSITGKVTSKGQAFTELKHKLTSELDSLVPDYKAARDAFAGPSALQNAIKKGRAFFNEDADSINRLTQGMTQGEIEAFRVGASDKLREMAGFQTGQNKLLDVWKNRNTREKLQALLGDDVKYAEVEKMLKNEATLKRLESIGPNSNSSTFRREANAEQQTLDGVADMASLAAGVKTGGVSSLIQGIGKYTARMGTPEPVRNSIGDILMSKYQPEEMKALQLALDAIKKRQNAAAAVSAAAGSRIDPFKQ